MARSAAGKHSPSLEEVVTPLQDSHGPSEAVSIAIQVGWRGLSMLDPQWGGNLSTKSWSRRPLSRLSAHTLARRRAVIEPTVTGLLLPRAS